MLPLERFVVFRFYNKSYWSGALDVCWVSDAHLAITLTAKEIHTGGWDSMPNTYKIIPTEVINHNLFMEYSPNEVSK